MGCIEMYQGLKKQKIHIPFNRNMACIEIPYLYRILHCATSLIDTWVVLNYDYLDEFVTGMFV